jgi:hypothetical protein
MEELIIRFGDTEGPRNPTELDVRKALEEIESGVCGRPEFTIENVSNWKPDVIDGRRVMRCRMEGKYMTAATFYHEGSAMAIGWFVHFRNENEHSFALSVGGG